MAIKVVKIAGTWREAEYHKRKHRNLTKEQADQIFAKKEFAQFNKGKGTLINTTA